MVLGEGFFVAIEEVPVQSCKWTGGIAGTKFRVIDAALAVVTHARDVSTACCIWFCHHEATICVHAHADDVGDHHPVGGIDKDTTHPFEELLWVGAGDKREVAQKHQAGDVMDPCAFVDIGNS